MKTDALKLRIIPISQALLHEETDPVRVQRLRERISENRFLRNPPIAAEGSNGGYVILDGATRTTALRELTARDLLVQIVEYGAHSAKVEAWNHVLPNVTVAGMVELIGTLGSAGVRQISITEAQQQLQDGEIHGYIFHQPGAALALTLGGEFDDRIRLLRSIVAMYKHHGEIYRLAQADLEHIIAERHEHSAVMVFPQFTPDDIRRIAMSPEKLPAGITRHIIPGRALNVNVPLDILLDSGATDDKNAWLDQWLTSRVVDGKVRYYHEPVFVFDE